MEWIEEKMYSKFIILFCQQSVIDERKGQVPFSMAIGNVELMRESFPKQIRMGKTIMK